MGIPRNPPAVMAWMSTLGAMKAAGTRVIRTCCGPCPWWRAEDLDALIAQLGPDARLHDVRPPCPACDGRNHFMPARAWARPCARCCRAIVDPSPSGRQAGGPSGRDLPGWFLWSFEKRHLLSASRAARIARSRPRVAPSASAPPA